MTNHRTNRAHETNRVSANFKNRQIWIFDLDNTLYPAQCDLFAQVDYRMGSFVAEFLGVDRGKARKIQKKYYREYGTTLSGLMTCHNLDPHLFLDYVHDIDLAAISQDIALSDALERLPGRKLILTNGSCKHAENVAGKLGVLHHFEDIFDIIAADFVPKPVRSTYERFLTRTNIDPREASMFEDLARNLEVPHDLGMATVLVRSPLQLKNERANIFDGVDAEAKHVHHVTDHLAGFLNVILQQLPRNG